ncbi:PIG-L family deacetylase [Streptomyces thermolilacinus]|uniref:PIG-L family deacetylase n=1 Tax=Streptomyces thermolilacinus TaxID=285540 RepID=UPI0033E490D2
MSDPVPLAVGRPFFFYTGHQDDESLWAGQVIAHHALVGRQVHIVLGSDGSTSAIRHALNGQESNGWWGSHHHPAREGIPAPLSYAAFAEARDRELLRAAALLGVPAERVHLRVAERSSAITVAEAERLILQHEALHPGAGHYTTHWTDPDPTHAALGQALRNLVVAGTITDGRWVVRRSQIGKVAGAVEYVVPSTYAAQARHMARAACRAYGSWAPPESYAIGRHSVPADLDWAESGASNWIVKTP